MNANGRRIANWASIFTVALAGSAVTAEASSVTAVVVTESLVGQSAENRVGQTMTVKALQQLLQQARQDIRSGNLDQAERLLTRAETANVRYPLIYFGLKPDKVRREFNTARRRTGVTRTANSGPASSIGRSPAAPRPPEFAEAPQVDNSRRNADPFSSRPAETAIAPAVIGPRHQISTQAYPTAGQPQRNPYPLDEQPLSALPDLPNFGRVAENPFKTARSDTQLDPPLPNPKSVSSLVDVTNPGNVAASTTGPAGAQPVPDGGEIANTSAIVADATDQERHDEAGQRVDRTPDAPLPAKKDRYAPEQTDTTPPAWAYDTSAALQEPAGTEGNVPVGASAVQMAAPLPGGSAPRADESAPLPRQDNLITWAEDTESGAQPASMTTDIPHVDLSSVTKFHVTATDTSSTDKGNEIRALHVAETDTTQNVHAAARTPDPESMRIAQLPVDRNGQTPLPNRLPQPGTSGARPGNLLEAGESALRSGDRSRALELFRQAEQFSSDLDTASRQRLQAHLGMLSESPPNGPSGTSTPSLLSSAEETTEVVARQLQADITKRQSEARRVRESDPKRALALLEEMRGQIVESNLPANVSSQLIRRVDLSLSDTEQYIEEHRAEIELEERNREVLAEIDRRRAVKIKVQEDIAELVDQFNSLRDEQRYAEMEIVAQRLYDLAPDEPVVQQVWQNAKFIRRTIINHDIANRREESNWLALNDVELSSIQEVGDGREITYGDPKTWEELTKRRGPRSRTGRLSERELEIQRRLRTPVLLRYENRPLSEVIDGLAQLTGVNIHLDPRGLYQENQTADVPVTINLSKEISLNSALNLILEPLHLSYVIKDEVLKITSEQLRDGELYFETYPVADLVIPIPNFVPTNNIGLQGLLNDAHAALGYGAGGFGLPGPVTLVNTEGRQVNGPGDPNMLAQQFGASAGPLPSTNVPINGGPGGLGGGANADFDSLIDLIISTVAPDTWAENGGGTADVRAFPTNLSLVISQTQAVHEEIQDLLEQLRRLQDLQVTIEVRFIRLSDDFFERIGLDFDLNIEDRTGISTTPGDPQALTPGAPFEPRRSSALVGIQQPTAINDYPNFTSNLDVEFRQNSFDLSAPTFGGLTSDMGQFGFAILSDIQATFLINAVQGDTRTNVLNAPKVTLFNGQQAFVADAAQVPFVISVVPVVGEFAAAQQPVIVVLSEGTLMSIQAVVSDDRRYVRLTVVPFFSDIGDVDTFTFEGSTSSTSSSASSTDDDGDGVDNSQSNSNDATNIVGTTVQLPTFQFVAVVTTVSVPDGGTVLLGGIKRLSEGRNERGIPILSKIPYVDRLFRNVGIGRTTDSLMMMVTPRIIIQEEEEEKLGIVPP